MDRHLSDEEAALHKFIDRLPVAAVHVNNDILYMNKAVEALVGYPRSKISTVADWFAILHPDQALALITKYRRAQAETGLKAYNGYFIRGDGAKRVLEMRGSTDALGHIWLLYDVTEQTTLNRELEEARRAADASNRAKSEFIANMSHEIRTPLNGVLAMAQLMSRSDPRPDQREQLNVIRASSQDLLRVINDILDFSKVDAGKLELECIDFDLEQALQSALSSFAVLAERNQIGLYLEVAPNARGLRRGDPTRLRQIINNLVSNALKFTTEGSVRIQIAGQGCDGRDGLTIAVTDTGPGISAEKLELLFNKFTQIDASTTRKFGGSGLGLAICKELATLMGGRVWAESEPGLGSTFWAELKIPFVGAQDAVLEPSDFDDFRGAVDDSEMLASVHILAAEDNPTNQLVLQTIMAAYGVELTIVNNGREAVDAWAAGEFDLVLMDVQMPVMDGIAATQLIRDSEARTGRRRTPIIALSANAFRDQVADYMRAGMDSYVAKPIDINLLQSAIERVLSDDDHGAPEVQHVA
jgi:signal transduction histidine kinase/ActR/RegA family two-component response regulator